MLTGLHMYSSEQLVAKSAEDKSTDLSESKLLIDD